MKVKKSWLVFTAVLVLALIITVFIPDDYSVKQSHKFKASPYELNALVGNFKTWKYWAIESGEKLDSIAEVKYEGAANTKGHKMIVEVDDKTMTYQIDSISKNYIGYTFTSDNKDKNIKSNFVFKKTEKDSTLVVWTINGNIGFKPILKITNLFIGVNKRLTLNMRDAFIRLDEKVAGK